MRCLDGATLEHAPTLVFFVKAGTRCTYTRPGPPDFQVYFNVRGLLMNNFQENIVVQENAKRPSLRPVHTIKFKACDLLDALIKHLGLKNDAALSHSNSLLR